MGGSARRTGAITLLLIVVSAGVMGAVAVLLRPDSAIGWVGVVGGVLGPPGLWLAWASYRDSRPDSALTLDQIADQVADAVRDQWRAEAEFRRLNDPYALSVRWRPADPGQVEDWALLEQLATGSGVGWPAPPPAGTWAAAPAALAGSGRELVDVLARVPTGRLVVLGEPGAGKTILLVRLVLDLLASRGPGGPVPVLVPLASWDPTGQHLYDWLESRLVIDHPGLAEPAPGRPEVSRARALLNRGLILPLLDGMDEIPDAVRGGAIAGINEAIQPGQRLVLAARSQPYQAAVSPPGGIEVRLTGAAGIALRPLDPADVADYLRATAGGRAGAARWEPVLTTLAASSPPPVARALTTPLMTALARAVYSPRPGEHTGGLPDPAELLDSSRFPTRTAVEQHLFDAFIRAAYRTHPDPARRCRWTAEQAERWLVHLARDLEYHRHGTTNLAWWELRGAAPRPLSGLSVGVIAGLAGALGLSFPIALGSGMIAGLTAGLVVRRWVGYSGRLTRGGIGGLLGGLIGVAPQILFGFGIRPESLDARLGGGLAFGLAVAPLGGFRAGLAGGLTGSLVGSFVGASNVGIAAQQLVNGAGLGLAAGLAAGLATRRGPARGLRWSPLGFACGVVVGVGLGSAVLLGQGSSSGLVVGLIAIVVGGLTGGFTVEAATADLTAAAGPDAVLKRDRSTFYTTALAAGLAFGVIIGLANGFARGYPVGIRVGVTNMIAAGLSVGFIQASWGSFILAKWWLAMRRRLPWRLMAFLADAHEKRGVLRQVGAVYQFRHAELQRRLANRP
jgi:hypothetical protein